MLKTILETRKKHLGPTHIATGETAYALGILRHITGVDTQVYLCSWHRRTKTRRVSSDTKIDRCYEQEQVEVEVEKLM